MVSHGEYAQSCMVKNEKKQHSYQAKSPSWNQTLGLHTVRFGKHQPGHLNTWWFQPTFTHINQVGFLIPSMVANRHGFKTGMRRMIYAMINSQTIKVLQIKVKGPADKQDWTIVLLAVQKNLVPNHSRASRNGQRIPAMKQPITLMCDTSLDAASRKAWNMFNHVSSCSTSPTRDIFIGIRYPPIWIWDDVLPPNADRDGLPI